MLTQPAELLYLISGAVSVCRDAGFRFSSAQRMMKTRGGGLLGIVEGGLKFSSGTKGG